MRFVVCVECYRTENSGTEEDDYFVDGMKLVFLDLPAGTREEQVHTFSFSIKQMMERLNTPENVPAFKATFPKFFKLLEEGRPFWFHAMEPEVLEKKPKEFHTNAFSEAELLGEPPEAEPVELFLNSSGDPIDGFPDKFMLTIGAV